MENTVREEKVLSLERVQGKKFRLRIALEKRNVERFDGLVIAMVLPNAKFVTAVMKEEGEDKEVVLQGKKEDLLALITPLGNHCINMMAFAEL